MKPFTLLDYYCVTFNKKKALAKHNINKGLRVDTFFLFAT